MKTTTKFAIGSVAVVALSAGVAGVTAYAMMEKNQDNTSFYESFETASPLRTAAFDASSMQPVDLTKAAESTLNSVVHIMSIQRSKIQTIQGQPDIFDFFFGDGRGQQRQIQTQPRVGFGSGVIISKDGYIVTNNHVVEGADEITVKLNDDRELKGRIIGTDPISDLALIKIEGDDFPTVPVGNSDELKVGEWVLAVGNPFNLTSTVTAGIVSAKSRGNIGAGGKDRSKIESFIQTDAAVNPGNSGGALVNTKGELVGINTAIYSETGNFAGYSFAVPISIAGKVANDLKQFGTVQRAVLGVLIQDPQYVPDAEKEKVKVFEGAYVGGFAERSSAKEAGIEKGDVIVAVNGVKIKSSSALQEQISKYRPGDKVELTINRNGSTKKFTVELRNAQGSTKVVKGGDSAEVMGAAFKALNDEQKRKLGVSYGIEVTGLTSGKLKDAGIKKGFIIMIVNNQKISAPEDLEKIVESILQGRTEDQGLFIKGFYPNGRTK